MQTLRVYRPRILIHGSVGMGQNYVGAAVLHHLEGYHVQTLEIGTLLGDSTRVCPSQSPIFNMILNWRLDCRSCYCTVIYRGQASSTVNSLHSFPPQLVCSLH